MDLNVLILNMFFFGLVYWIDVKLKFGFVIFDNID